MATSEDDDQFSWYGWARGVGDGTTLLEHGRYFRFGRDENPGQEILVWVDEMAFSRSRESFVVRAVGIWTDVPESEALRRLLSIYLWECIASYDEPDEIREIVFDGDGFQVIDELLEE